MSREPNYDLYCPAVAYYDGQGFMLPRSRNIDSALDLNNSKVCVQEGTTTLLNVADYFRANNMKYTEMKFPKLDDVVKAYNEGKCDTLTADVSQLYALRLNLTKPDDHVIRLGEVEAERVELGDVGGQGVALALVIGFDHVVQLGELHLRVFHVVGAEIIRDVEQRGGAFLHA